MLHWIQVDYQYDEAKTGTAGDGTIYGILDVPNDRRNIPLWAALQAMTTNNAPIETRLPAQVLKVVGAFKQRQKRLEIPKTKEYSLVFEHKTNGKVLAAEIQVRSMPALNVPNTYGMEFK